MATNVKQNILPRRMSPLWVIASFVSVTEAVATVSLGFTTGYVQFVLVLFVVAFAFAVLGCFFATLWLCPGKLYSPYDYPGKITVPEIMAIWGPRKDELQASQNILIQTVEAATKEARSTTDSSSSRVEAIIEEGYSQVRRAEVQAKLSRELERMSFADIHLMDVLMFLREYSDLNMHVEWRALFEIGLVGTTLISIDARKITVQDSLDILIADLNSTMPADCGLVYTVEQNGVRITTTLALQREKERNRQVASE
jgi:hypothetical protein